ncbi:hypothetical protein B0H19DRAFT_1077083 [Mycena capillaripes]|nr:hypothetical protein B0H19DRAFT_1077083 [Mycena capillaripes]
MFRFAVLFNSAARVWNLRLLLLWTVGIFGYLIYSSLPYGVNLPTALVFAGCSLLFLHHVLGAFRWPFKGSALFDLGLVLLEITALAYTLYQMMTRDAPILDNLAALGPVLVLLILSAVFRIATIIKTEQSFLHQRFSFLGSCTQTHPPYTPLRILLNRSIARPLRAMILSLIAIGVPAFAIYSIIITPLATEIYRRDLVQHPFAPSSINPFNVGGPLGKATILLDLVGPDTTNSVADIQMHATDLSYETFECRSVTTDVVFSVECASIKLTLSQAPGNLSPEWKEAISDWPAVPLVPGSSLFGLLTWTRRDVISKSVVWGPSPRTTVFTADVTGLQPTIATVGSGVATLKLFQQRQYATRILQDTLDSTALSGIATFGGFWTFLNGAFALCFGANVIYFMFDLNWQFTGVDTKTEA